MTTDHMLEGERLRERVRDFIYDATRDEFGNGWTLSKHQADDLIAIVCNPDGHEAATALEHLRAENKRLNEDWLYLHKWIERGLFCSHTDAKTALEAIAYHPSAPWQNGRWDVDHKPYAEKFYKAFPKAKGESPSGGR